jgi:hypothetical protein
MTLAGVIVIHTYNIRLDLHPEHYDHHSGLSSNLTKTSGKI